MASPTSSPSPSPKPPTPPAATSSSLPPLSAADFATYNRIASRMDLFHNHFRHIWEMLHTAAESGSRPAHLSLKAFIDEGLLFVRMLTAHHNIEETYLYPQLEARMEEFRVHAQAHEQGHELGVKEECEAEAASGEAGTGAETSAGLDAKGEPEYPPDLIGQHRAIHKGMDEFEDYLRACRRGEKELSMATLLTQMDSWGGVLWRHLDEEVEALGAENMRKYWTLEEMRGFGI